jgi:hypothetical protein
LLIVDAPQPTCCSARIGGGRRVHLPRPFRRERSGRSARRTPVRRLATPGVHAFQQSVAWPPNVRLALTCFLRPPQRRRPTRGRTERSNDQDFGGFGERAGLLDTHAAFLRSSVSWPAARRGHLPDSRSERLTATLSLHLVPGTTAGQRHIGIVDRLDQDAPALRTCGDWYLDD